jgi:hypothetical protein
VEASLHRHDRLAGEVTEQQPAAVALDGRDGETRDVLVWDGRFGLDLIGQRTETGTQDDRKARFDLRASTNRLG